MKDKGSLERMGIELCVCTCIAILDAHEEQELWKRERTNIKGKWNDNRQSAMLVNVRMSKEEK